MADKKEQAKVLTDAELAAIEGSNDVQQATVAPPKPAAGVRLPEGFENPPPGEDGHLCIDTTGRYNPEWVCLYLFKHNDTDQDPVPVTCAGDRYWVPREKWVDVPRSVAIGLGDAVEIRHNSDFDVGKVLGVDTNNVEPIRKTQQKVRRFVFETRASA